MWSGESLDDIRGYSREQRMIREGFINARFNDYRKYAFIIKKIIMVFFWMIITLIMFPLSFRHIHGREI